MPRKNELTWSELRVGVFVLAGILVVMLGIFYVTGVEVGNVDSIKVARPQAGEVPNQKRSVEVVLRVNRDFQNDIRTDSTAALLTEGFLGDRVVSVQRGYTGMVLKRNTASRRKP
jgi:ABC-type transporter Mla subunit MlaD